MKKFLTTFVVLALATVMAVGLTACGRGWTPDVGASPERDQLNGRWNLTRIVTEGMPPADAYLRIIQNGHMYWTGDYFIEFDEDGNFSELDFWNWFDFDVTVSYGTFELSGNNLTLTRAGGIAPASMEYGFLGNRFVGISSDGNTLTISYRRSQGNYGGRNNNFWVYTMTFTRVQSGCC